MISISRNPPMDVLHQFTTPRYTILHVVRISTNPKSIIYNLGTFAHPHIYTIINLHPAYHSLPYLLSNQTPRFYKQFYSRTITPPRLHTPPLSFSSVLSSHPISSLPPPFSTVPRYVIILHIAPFGFSTIRPPTYI